MSLNISDSHENFRFSTALYLGPKENAQNVSE